MLVSLHVKNMALIKEVKDRCAADTILETYDLP